MILTFQGVMMAAIDDFSLTPTGTSADNANCFFNNPSQRAATVSSTSTIAAPLAKRQYRSSSFAINCSISGVHRSRQRRSRPTLDQTVILYRMTIVLSLSMPQMSLTDANDPPDTMAADLTFSFTVSNPASLPIHHLAIQGTGASAAITGTVTTQGVVVSDYEGASQLYVVSSFKARLAMAM